jgi:hypothetical protein
MLDRRDEAWRDQAVELSLTLDGLPPTVAND